ncbi:MAG: noncanonical pyrimidine nucleotidase, YjjG family [Bacteroidetes bacterium]|nr:noncanonical pyrimidine nucleotidase, YjjG family [Bacteroidota bacterium]MBK8144256.1 noncanonical pyrimidine nucleotidase, YjjG family [Bacteroidota bacterium]MBP6314204.1 YjjG family noncanonical pyrimidine nucleotidase [Chitinophagaceae bacterium]
MSAIKYLFFDLDHTLWDFETNSVSTLSDLHKESQLDEKGIPSFDDFNAVYHSINDRLWEEFRKGLLSREDLRWKRMWQTLLHYGIYDVPLAKEMSEKYLEILPTKNSVFPYTVEVLQYCKDKKYEMHLITNGFELTQNQKLKNANLDVFFDKMITSEQAMSMKPHAGIFEYAFNQTGATCHNSLMIGDALEIDIAGAMNVGMSQIFFNPKKIPHNHQPTYEIHCLSEIKTIL